MGKNVIEPLTKVAHFSTLRTKTANGGNITNGSPVVAELKLREGMDEMEGVYVSPSS